MQRSKDRKLLASKEQAKSTALCERRNGRSMPAVQRAKGRGTR